MEFPLGLGAGIAIQDGAIPSRLCRKVIKFFEERDHLSSPGRTAGGFNPGVKNSTDSYLDRTYEGFQSDKEREKVSKMEHSMWQCFTKVMTDYCSRYEPMQNWTGCRDTGYQFQRYKKGDGFYKPHIDGSPFSVGYEDRVLAAVFYLNTVEEGGGTHFEYFDYTCDAVEGRIVLFPTTFLHLHAGLVPESGDKCIISTFANAVLDT